MSQFILMVLVIGCAVWTAWAIRADQADLLMAELEALDDEELAAVLEAQERGAA